MNRRIKPVILIISALLILKPLWADGASYWQCTASDSDGNQWIGKSIYERAATSKAFDACKKQSRVPASCKADVGICEGFDHGISISPMWQCTALDERGHAWNNPAYNDRDAAALTAKTLCKENSAVPESCYINLLTCKNLNQRS